MALGRGDWPWGRGWEVLNTAGMNYNVHTYVSKGHTYMRETLLKEDLTCKLLAKIVLFTQKIQFSQCRYKPFGTSVSPKTTPNAMLKRQNLYVTETVAQNSKADLSTKT